MSKISRPRPARAAIRAAAGLAAAGLALAAGLAGAAAPAAAGAGAQSCRAGTLYLTFDTGSMSQAALIADTLRRHHVKATFFLANEPTVNKDSSLDPGWAPYWKTLAADGHVFGSHTFDHVYLRGTRDGKVTMRPQFGAQAGQDVAMDQQGFCAELKRSAQALHSLSGATMSPLWRAPGGHTAPQTLQWAEQCGFKHVGWAPAGFLGDELSSERFPNKALLARALRDLRDGDITMAHLGIWSRKDPWAPAVLEPLISGLERKGFCFATLREHPAYREWFRAQAATVAAGGAGRP
ncbi:polysaccharide deacetylase family protein [Cupriavidus basilensis]|uniref:polysaccharide deacetylase family protein n=1 Tax=Cupriavidus basilensis TaxID=68895 RepID=UPI00075173F3|nr:polysaccharide deacetylase family protein [Cupriavidus basilensis]